MSTSPMPRLISCDESGFSGNDMLKSGQPFFGYGSHDLSLQDSNSILAEARAKYPVQMPELKANLLLGSKIGRSLMMYVLEKIEGHYIATLCDKKYSLSCKLFEYIFEPVIQSNNLLFYNNNFHRFVSSYFYVQMIASSSDLSEISLQFQNFMRSLDPAKAPLLFGPALSAKGDPLLEQVLRFARGYHSVISQETKSLERSGAGKWVLDLTTTSIFSHLTAWGERYPQIEVVCDDSKPLLALAGLFDVMINRSDKAYMDAFGKKRPLTWNMSVPLRFASSKDHSGVQLADLIAGATTAIPRAAEDDTFREIADCAKRHLHEDCVVPDLTALDLEGDEAPVNWRILEALASRADAGADPLAGMEQEYAAAKATLPEFRRLTSS
ncbi:DUF3800 domain-containing protein [Methylobacterium sp. WL6]|uniref:DUF3800 domain-containing protein n=1 Tax=Methylobacterium sp. WL6 TaxID=2603901 RepID=UPI0011C78E56|nr:DUF3800 domain-containing protein [Methylobacterium sp. WL6]TXN67876.1 DUF3800 domain-containing protein [Methylobacterium sp. WL6]